MTVNRMIGNMVSSFRTKLCLMGCLNAHIIIFISRDRFMDIRRQGIYRCMSYRSFDTGRLWGNIICLCLAKTKFCSSASGNISFLPQLAVLLWSDFIHCLFCLRCGFFRFSSSLFYRIAGQIILSKTESGRSFRHLLPLLFFGYLRQFGGHNTRPVAHSRRSCAGETGSGRS